MACNATMGVCRPAQISQRPGLTSTIAHSTSRGACDAAGNSNSPSIDSMPGGAGSSGGSAARRRAWIAASDRPLFGPSPQVMSSARQASQASPKVCAITATPGGMPTTAPPPGMISTATTPGIASTASRLFTLTTRPRICDGMRHIVGIAPGTSMSIVNFLRPVTMSSASSLRVALPMMRYCAGWLGAGAWGSSPACRRAWVTSSLMNGSKLRIVDEPPVSWLNSSSGWASAETTFTLSSVTPASSAIIIASAVPMPVPCSRRGSSKT